jgi:ferritin
MLSKKMEKALNEQINKEMFSAYIYLSMATFLRKKVRWYGQFYAGASTGRA